MKQKISIDEVKDKRIRNIESMKIIDSSTIEIKVKNQKDPLVLKAFPVGWGEEAKIFLEI